MNRLAKIVASTAIVLLPAIAAAGCSVEGAGEVNVLMNFFPTTQILDAAMEGCERDDLKVVNKLSPDHKVELQQAFSASSSPFDAAHVTNSSITQLQAKGLLQPLNDLVEAYGEAYDIEPGMQIKFGDEIMAIAFMANAQVLYYRKDLFDKHGLEVPKTWDDVLAVSEVLKDDPDIQFPFGAAYASGWELGNDFLDLFIGSGGVIIDPATGEAGFAGPEGVAALELMKSLYGYMSPNALTIDFGGVKQQMQQGQIAMAFLWGDLAASMDDPNESRVVGKVQLAPAPAIAAGGAPATLFWWDGFALPRNMDGDRAVVFQTLMESLRPEVVEANNDATLWLRSNYQPNDYSAAITESVEAGAQPYPMTTAAELAHAALGENIGDFLAGKESAQQALDDAARVYRQAAIDAGIIK